MFTCEGCTTEWSTNPLLAYIYRRTLLKGVWPRHVSLEVPIYECLPLSRPLSSFIKVMYTSYLSIPHLALLCPRSPHT